MFKLPKLDFLPNPPHKGLPTPRGWGQTWDSFERRDSLAGGIVIGTTGLGGLIGAAVGVGIGMAAGPASVAIPIALAVMGTGGTLGAGFGGLIIKGSEKND